MSDDDMNRQPGATSTALEPSKRASRAPVSRLAAPIDLVDIAQEIQQADTLLGAVVGGQLDVIAEQIRALQQKARDLLERAEVNAQLHRAECNFRKRSGHVYHLYRRMDAAASAGRDLYFSMLSPTEWGPKAPHAFEGSYRLELDMSFTRVD